MALLKLPFFTRANGAIAEAIGVTLLGLDGKVASLGGQAYSLAGNVAIPANTGTAAVGPIQSGTYVWDAAFAGTGPLKLQALGADGATWRDVASLNASGTLAGEIRVGQDAMLRLFSTTALTAVSSVLS